MCLTDNNFKNLPTGDVVDKIIRELKHEDLIGTTDNEGHFETSLYHGDYEATISHPDLTSSSSSVGMKFNVVPTTNQEALDVKFSSISFP